jgi:hypothetical protein
MESAPDKGTKGLLVKGIGVGVGLALGVCFVVASFYWYAHRTKGWDSTSITSSYESANFHANPRPGGYFGYVLQNNTGRDYSVFLSNDKNPNLRIAAKVGHEPNVALMFGGIDAFLPFVSYDSAAERVVSGEPLFVPAKQRVHIILRWELPSEELKRTTSVKIVNETLHGFVLFDEQNRIRIDFSPPTPLQGTYTEADVDHSGLDQKATIRNLKTGETTSVKLVETIPPDSGDIFDHVAGCNEADTIVQTCKVKKIPLPKGSFANYGGYQVPLPKLPKVPEGYKLDVGLTICDTAAQWQAYCRAHSR